jgi:hypothetical protein
MKTVAEDPAAFFEEGGWSFLSADADVRFLRVVLKILKDADLFVD